MGNEKGIIGVDTGFFYALRDDDKTATRLLLEKGLVISILTVFELRRAALKEGN